MGKKKRSSGSRGDSGSRADSGSTNSPSEKKRNILVLDGGGVKGIHLIKTLRKIQEEINRMKAEDRDENPSLELADQFDLIVGTSAGAIVGAAVGFRLFSLEETEARYEQVIRNVFEGWIRYLFRRLLHALANLVSVPFFFFHGVRRWLDFPWYSASNLEKELRDPTLLGERTLEDFQAETLDSLRRPYPHVAFVATDADETQAKAFTFRNYSLPHRDQPPEAEDGQSRHLITFPGDDSSLAWKAIRASSSAPPYFRPIEFEVETEDGRKKKTFIDGGLLHNNPIEVAFQEACMLWGKDAIDLIVTIGCGKSIPRSGRGNLLTLGDILVTITTATAERHDDMCRWLKAIDHPAYVVRMDAPEAGDIPLDCTGSGRSAAMRKLEDFFTESPLKFAQIYERLKAQNRV